ncbi:MAG: hypothetical protein ACLFWB_13455, partial [Armatimonadota bacterium]
ANNATTEVMRLMSGGRLFDTGPNGRGVKTIEADRRVALSKLSGRCGLAVCLQSALMTMERDVSYGVLMGLLNAAFMLEFDPDFAPEAAIESRWRRLPETLADLGYPGAVVQEKTPDPAAVAEEIEHQRPVLVYRWNDETVDWSLIYGVEASTEQWRGFLFAPGPQDLKMAAASDLAVLFGRGKVPGPLEKILRPAIEEAAEIGASPAGPVAEYMKWAEAMADDDIFPAGPEGDERLLRHEWFAEVLVDARDAAAMCFREAAQELPLVREAFVDMADLYERVCETLETRRPPISSPIASERLREPEVRGEWAERLLAAAELEKTAFERMIPLVNMVWE